MVNEVMNTIFESRILIGYLGEKHQSNWWGSSFLSPSSIAFLAPVFPKSTFTAQYQGVCLAASRIHDEHIGLGSHYHLYRLPDSFERALAKISQDPTSPEISKHITERDSAINRLQALTNLIAIEYSEGPVNIGEFSEKGLTTLIKKSLSFYLKAFDTNSKCFPFLRHKL